MVFACVDTVLEFTWDLVETRRGVTHDEPGLTRTGIACAQRAGLACILRGLSDMQAGLREDAGDGALLLVECEGFNAAGEVLDCPELCSADDDGDADGIDLWIQQVSSVSRGVHPHVVDDDGSGGGGYVFCDEAEVCAGIGSAFGEIGFAVELMGDRGVGSHFAGVMEGGSREDTVVPEGWKSLRGAALVGGGEEILFGYGLCFGLDCEGDER